MKPAVFFVLLASFLVGCAEERTYQVSVKNTTAAPVAVWLFKAGGPYENGWKSPEEIATEAPGDREPAGWVIVPAGKIATAGPIKGKFNSDATAILRVYFAVPKSFNELLAFNRDSPERQETPLPQGASSYILTNDTGKPSIQRVSPLPKN